MCLPPGSEVITEDEAAEREGEFSDEPPAPGEPVTIVLKPPERPSFFEQAVGFAAGFVPFSDCGRVLGGDTSFLSIGGCLIDALPIAGAAVDVVKQTARYAPDVARTADNIADVGRATENATDAATASRRTAGSSGGGPATPGTGGTPAPRPTLNAPQPTPGVGTSIVRYEPYPPAATSPGGFVGAPVRDTLRPGAAISRYGGEGGSYVSPAGTPFSARALPPAQEALGESVYTVVRPIDVDAGIAAWWQGGGGGIQYRLPSSVADLIEGGFLKRADL